MRQEKALIPFLGHPLILRILGRLAFAMDEVIPSTPRGLEPLHAAYLRETCLPAIQSALKAGRLKLVGWLP